MLSDKYNSRVLNLRTESYSPTINKMSVVNPYRASKYFTDWVLTADKVGAIL